MLMIEENKLFQFFFVVVAFLALSISWVASFLLFLTFLLIKDWKISQRLREPLEGLSKKKIMILGLIFACFIIIISAQCQDRTIEPSQGDYGKMVSEEEYNDLLRDYNDLQEEYNNLVEDYNELNNRLASGVFPPYIVVENRTFTIAYKDLDNDTHTYWWEGYLIEQFWAGHYMRSFSIE